MSKQDESTSAGESAATRKSLADLVAIMAALRTPVTGCPWDLEQSFTTIAPYTIEEAYEVADAIQRGDRVDLKEELGDLLLQVVYHARLAEEESAFTLADVVDGITRKMIRRHPHVFGDAIARSAGMAKGAWERIKAVERAEKAEARARLAASRAASSQPLASSPGYATAEPSLLADVPITFPALLRAIKLQEKAARVGFDWPNLKPVFEKMREEMSELEAVALPADPRGSDARAVGADPGNPTASSPKSAENQSAIAEELGDLLFVVANVARHLGVEPETALRGANEKFERRFRHIERELAARGRRPDQSTLEEMDGLWDAAKALERST